MKQNKTMQNRTRQNKTEQNQINEVKPVPINNAEITPVEWIVYIVQYISILVAIEALNFIQLH